MGTGRERQLTRRRPRVQRGVAGFPPRVEGPLREPTISDGGADSECQPWLTLSAEAAFPGKQGLVRSGQSPSPHADTHRQPPLTLFGIRERRPSLKCWLQVVVPGGVDGFPPLLRKLGTPFAFEPLLCKRPQQPSLRSQNQRCTVRESRNFPACTIFSRPTTMTSRLRGRIASKKRMGIGADSSTTWCYATLTAEF